MALALLKRGDLAPVALEALSKNASVIQRRKVRLGVIAHPKTPRRVSLSILRQLYTFDLMQAALLPTVPADVKKAAEETLVTRLDTIASGERLALARRASARIAGELLKDKEARVMQTALENPRLTESAIIKAILRRDASAALVQAVCHHARWSVSREVRIALLRNDTTPLARAIAFARSLPPTLIREVLQNSRLPATTKTSLLRDAKQARAAKS
ncbi:MAG TPA: hypothetical protein VGF08_04030 [Terriglobales bacterium]